MPDFEQVGKFEAQIERSLDEQIDELREVDRKKSRALSRLKDDILREISRQRGDDPDTNKKDQAFSEDLRLAEDELSQIFEALRLEHRGLFRRNRIETFVNFKELIGLESSSNGIVFDDLEQDKYEMVQVQTKPEVAKETPDRFLRSKFELFGQPVNFDLPKGASEQMIDNYRRCFANIESRGDFRSMIQEQRPTFTPNGPLRVEFSLNQNGRIVKYSATPNEFFRVDEEPTPGQIRRFRRTFSRLKKIRGSRREGSLANVIRKRFVGAKEERRRTKRVLFDLDANQVVEERSEDPSGEDFHYAYLKKEDNRPSRGHSDANVDKKVWLNKHNGNVWNDVRYDSERVTASYYRADGTLEYQEVKNGDIVEVYNGEGKLQCRIDNGKPTIIGKNGKEISTLDEMRKEHPDMTPDEYIDFLAEELDSSKMLFFLSELLIQYKYDDAEVAEEQEKKFFIGRGRKKYDGTAGEDHWQTAQQMVCNIEDGRMTGDCEDYGFLIAAILRKQGIQAQVVSIPGHATCIWLQKREDGRYDAYSLGTEGLDKNGNLFGPPPDPEKEKGYATKEEAVNSLMAKYVDENWAASSMGVIDGKIKILEFKGGGNVKSNKSLDVFG